MSHTRNPKLIVILVGLSLTFGLASFALGQTANVSTDKLVIKDNADPAKRLVQLESSDPLITYSSADNPGRRGAVVYVYSATDRFCADIPFGAEWDDTGSVWKYQNKTTKDSIQLSDGKLKLKLRSNVTFSLDEPTGQGAVNVTVQFGKGTEYCLRCDAPARDDATQFSGFNCVAQSCDGRPGICPLCPVDGRTGACEAVHVHRSGCDQCVYLNLWNFPASCVAAAAPGSICLDAALNEQCNRDMNLLPWCQNTCCPR